MKNQLIILTANILTCVLGSLIFSVLKTRIKGKCTIHKVITSIECMQFVGGGNVKRNASVQRWCGTSRIHDERSAATTLSTSTDATDTDAAVFFLNNKTYTFGCAWGGGRDGTFDNKLYVHEHLCALHLQKLRFALQQLSFQCGSPAHASSG